MYGNVYNTLPCATGVMQRSYIFVAYKEKTSNLKNNLNVLLQNYEKVTLHIRLGVKC